LKNKFLKIVFSFVLVFFSTIAFAQEPPDHSGLDIGCADELAVPLSTSDWFDCPFPGDIIHCQGFVEIGSNLSPNNKLEVSHGDGEFIRQGISLNNTRSDEIRTNEIYFRHKNNEQWALGNDFFTVGKHDFFLWDHINEITRMYFSGDTPQDSRLGINHNTTPIATLDVNGDIRSGILAGATTADIVQADNNGILQNVPITNFKSNLNYWALGSNGYDLYRTTKVFIGMSPCASCTTNSYNLYVAAGIATNEVRVTAPTNPWPDFVFDKHYKLRTISELEQYVSKNKHLPNVPGADEVIKNEGFELGAMQSKILQTIEEQTLYIIDLQKQLTALKAEMVAIKNK